MKNNLMPHQNTKNYYDPVILFLSIHPKEEKYSRFTHIYAHGSTIHNNQEMEVCAGTRPGVNRPGLYNMLWKRPYYWCQATNPPRWMQLRLTKSQAGLMASFKPAPSVGLFAGWVTQRLWSSNWLRLIWNYLKEHFTRRIQKIFVIK